MAPNSAPASLPDLSALARRLGSAAQETGIDMAARYQTAFETAPIGMAVVALDGRWILANLRLCGFLGYTKQELLQLDFQQLTHPEDLAPDVTQAARLLAGEIATYTLDKRYRRSDGTYLWARLTGSLIRGPDGSPREFVAIVEDIAARRAAEAELRRARRRLESALAASEVGTFEWDVLADRLHVDANFLLIQPVPVEADGTTLSGHVLERLHPDDRQRVTEVVQNCVRTGDPYEADYRYLAGDEVRWISARGKMTKDADGRVVTFYGAVTDITRRKQAEAEREQLARRYQQLSAIHETVLRTTSDFAYLFDREGRFLYANERLLTVWAKTLPEIVGKTFYELGYPDWHADRHQREIAQIIATKQPIRGEVPFTGASGIFGIYDYIFSPVLGADGEVEYIAGTSRDVTARKQTEVALQESEQRLTLAQRAGAVGVYDWNVETGEVVWTSELERIYGVTAPADPKAHAPLWAKGLPPDERERLERLTREWLESGREEAHWEYRYLRPDGEERWISGRSIVVRREDLRPVRVVGTNIDITQRKRAEAALHQAKEEAEKANSAKDRFLAVLSHELRTPLTPVVAAAQLLEAQDALSVEQRELVRTIRRNVELEARLIDDLLDLTRIRHGKLVLHLAEIRVHESLRQVLAICAAEIHEKQLEVVTQFAALHDQVRADDARLQQIFWNLLKNAVKFTPPGGRIEISTEQPDARHLLVTVRDNGIGIDAAVLPHLFEVFEQGGPDVTRQFGGLGLGLAVSRRLAELHGGSISAASEGRGRGATFAVRLPVSEPDAASSVRRVFETAPRLQATVLLVEDHVDTRKTLTQILRRLGCEVKTAGTAAEALQLAEAHRCDLVISDIGLPDATGTELMAQLARRHGLRGIALSGYGMEEDRLRSAAAGFAAHLTKPVRMETLVESVRRLLAP